MNSITAVLPEDYIFGDKSAFFSSSVPDIPSASAKDSLFGFDIGFTGTLTAATVTESGGNLLSLDFMASSNARGWFGVFAQPSGLSEWSDDEMMPQEFSNIEGPTLIGLIHVDSVTSVIPEPASIMVWLGLAVFGVCFNRKRLRP